VASLEVTEAFKIMLGKEPMKELMVLDVWLEEFQKIKVKKDPACQTCAKLDFKYLEARERKFVASLCGRNAVQIVPTRELKEGLPDLRKKLSKLGDARLVDGVLKFSSKEAELTVFSDGRTIVSGTTDAARAKTIFSKYIGD
jgi:adenylyltransferase/sulfurtransferase